MDTRVSEMIPLLAKCGGGAAKAAHELGIVLAGGAGGEAGAPATGTAGAAGLPEIMALEDLQMMPGGRHDNDHAAYRCVHLDRVVRGFSLQWYTSTWALSHCLLV